MSTELPRKLSSRRTGDEIFHFNGQPLGAKLLDFWSWSRSDLISNTTRGILAEFIVADALGIPLDDVRDEWEAFDLITTNGITVEVKSAAYIQSWRQAGLSSIIFRVPKTRAWNADTNIQERESRRQAQVYVFALLAHKDKATIDPLNVGQWSFFVLPTTYLNARARSQHSITLRSLEALAGRAVSYHDLQVAVNRAAGQRSNN